MLKWRVYAFGSSRFDMRLIVTAPAARYFARR
jgi:hypothetical protein